MTEEVSSKRWRLYELASEEERRLFISVPDGKILSTSGQFTISREMAPEFLGPTGWIDSAQMLSPASVKAHGEDLYLEIPAGISTMIDEFEFVMVSLPDAAVQGVLSWDAEAAPAEVATEEKAVEKTEIEETGIVDPVAAPAPPPTEPGPGVKRNAVVIGGLSLLLLGVAASIYFYQSGDEPESKPTTGSTQGVPPPVPPAPPPVVTPPPPALPVAPPPPVPPAPPPPPPSQLEQFRNAMSDGNFSEARNLLDSLIADGNPEAALIAAEEGGRENFRRGLFDQRSLPDAFDFYSVACQGGATAKDSLRKWLASIKQSGVAGSGLSQEQYSELVDVAGPELLENCQN